MKDVRARAGFEDVANSGCSCKDKLDVLYGINHFCTLVGGETHSSIMLHCTLLMLAWFCMLTAYDNGVKGVPMPTEKASNWPSS